MVKKILIGLGGLLVLVVLVIGGFLAWAHVGIRREVPPLPPAAALAAALDSGAGPVHAWMINTASQAMPRSAVLDVRRDPHPEKPYVMSFPAFVLEWSDGRLLLVDAGMGREATLAFGARIETLAGGKPIRPLGAVAERLGAAAKRVQGLVFTHLHNDHVDGIKGLCGAAGHRLRVFMTQAQAERPNYTTRDGLELLEASGCVQEQILSRGPLFRLPGFPGVLIVPTGGHTPGSQLVAARVGGAAGGRRYLFAGDVTNHIDGINYDIPKPFLYRTLLVPEFEGRQAEIRALLRRLRDEDGFTLLVSHDQRQLEQTGPPAWASNAAGAPDAAPS